MVAEGSFVLYSRVEPPLKAGDYRFESSQVLGASKDERPLGPDDLAVQPLETHVRVRSPQYQLPPDQVLSTFPPAGREGAFGSRLPQIVIKRRTLPWERAVHPDPALEKVPWLALVVIAEGEAQLLQNLPVAECVTPGTPVAQPADVETANCLSIRRSMLHRIFPTREEVGLLAHARQVDIHDTELMMGDDDGFLAVVIANRLPLAGRAPEGGQAPVKYLACLVNLAGQFEALLPQAPPHVTLTPLPIRLAASTYSLAQADKLHMGAAAPAGAEPKAAAGTTIRPSSITPGAPAAREARAGWGTGEGGRALSDVYVEMARGFGRVDVGDRVVESLDPTYRFPVLIHWSFTSTGQATFKTLMNDLTSGLLGTTEGSSEIPKGRLPLEVVETGHVGLHHRTRNGDQVRSWYRGPLVPHPTADPPDGRLRLAHAADQIRIVVPDGREDLSLAGAFEIGRLLGLSRPSMVAALMRWRQQHYQAAQRRGVLAGSPVLSEAILGLVGDLDASHGGRLGAHIARAMVTRPAEILGDPRPLVDPGRPVMADVSANQVLATGFGINPKVLAGTSDVVLDRLRSTAPKLPRVETVAPEVRDHLAERLDQRFARTAYQALAQDLASGLVAREDLRGLPVDLVSLERLEPKGADALDDLIAALAEEPEPEEDR